VSITGTEEEEVKAKGIHNTFNNIITENFPNIRKDLPIQVHGASWKPNRLNENRTSLWHIIVKTISTENKERLLKAVREKNQITYKSVH
jgi:hypothetical protein